MKDVTRKVIKRVEGKWFDLNAEDRAELKEKRIGIRSSQIVALIDLLIDFGIIKEEHLEG